MVLVARMQPDVEGRVEATEEGDVSGTENVEEGVIDGGTPRLHPLYKLTHSRHGVIVWSGGKPVFAALCTDLIKGERKSFGRLALPFVATLHMPTSITRGSTDLLYSHAWI